MREVVQVTDATFLDDVLMASYKEPVVVLFSSPTCAPCQRVKPLLEELSQLLDFRLCIIDAGANYRTTNLESVRSVPSILVYSKGRQVGLTCQVGAMTDIKHHLSILGIR